MHGWHTAATGLSLPSRDTQSDSGPRIGELMSVRLTGGRLCASVACLCADAGVGLVESLAGATYVEVD
ncbi:hypothetical protein DN051_01930 [Streptomyces cadmiisoli]|uniref:Uncharacterized protein n=1 Tax=Streptomyces cadmiisoli TaxID=2184053 RepID=A0A2Z4IRW0_9ACTN|nr:hypothetical protein DN051_01930 [Streptomyces cadmiisoli]